MADVAAHLVDHVLPVAPYRQWTLSLPHDIRLLVIRNPDLLNRVLQLFLRAVFAYQRRRARKDGIKDPMPASPNASVSQNLSRVDFFIFFSQTRNFLAGPPDNQA